ncbi:Uncharacterized protein dnm_031990 [Desulfonema magnum]|uniref:Uncharacterized protein n=1 Tax=Desulfonema magnum TaxID=45655 RepID=A0A975BK42_9BACT|nr:Uncharacterized protein dnm_031990 [Desulfonema magnum]
MAKKMAGSAFYTKKSAIKTQRHKVTTKTLRDTSCLRGKKNGRFRFLSKKISHKDSKTQSNHKDTS